MNNRKEATAFMQVFQHQASHEVHFMYSLIHLMYFGCNFDGYIDRYHGDRMVCRNSSLFSQENH